MPGGRFKRERPLAGNRGLFCQVDVLNANVRLLATVDFLLATVDFLLATVDFLPGGRFKRERPLAGNRGLFAGNRGFFARWTF